MNKTYEFPARRAVRRVLSVRNNTVTFCTWDGENPHHAHAIHLLARGAVVSVGDDVSPKALGGYVAHRWYRRVGDECLMAHGDGTLCNDAPGRRGTRVLA